MPHAEALIWSYGDGDPANSIPDTQSGTAKLSGGSVVITPTLGLGTDVLTLTAADLAARLDQALAMIVASPSLGFSLDITDDPSNATDAQLVYTEPVSGAPATLRVQETIAQFQTGSVETAQALRSALTGLGV